jgi:hypothetical protein
VVRNITVEEAERALENIHGTTEFADEMQKVRKSLDVNCTTNYDVKRYGEQIIAEAHTCNGDTVEIGEYTEDGGWNWF